MRIENEEDKELSNIEEIKEKYKNIEPAEATNTKTEETEPIKSENDLIDLPF